MENKTILYYCWLLSLQKSFTTALSLGDLVTFMVIGIMDEHWRTNITLGFYPTSANYLQHCPIILTFLYLNYCISVPSCPVVKMYLQSLYKGIWKQWDWKKTLCILAEKTDVPDLFSQSHNFKPVGFVNSHWFVLHFSFWKPWDGFFPLIPCWQFWQALKKLWVKANHSSEVE